MAIVTCIKGRTNCDHRLITAHGPVQHRGKRPACFGRGGKRGRPDDRPGVEQGAAFDVIHFEDVAEEGGAEMDVRFSLSNDCGDRRLSGTGHAGQPIQQMQARPRPGRGVNVTNTLLCNLLDDAMIGHADHLTKGPLFWRHVP